MNSFVYEWTTRQTLTSGRRLVVFNDLPWRCGSSLSLPVSEYRLTCIGKQIHWQCADQRAAGAMLYRLLLQKNNKCTFFLLAKRCAFIFRTKVNLAFKNRLSTPLHIKFKVLIGVDLLKPWFTLEHFYMWCDMSNRQQLPWKAPS